VGKMGVQMRNIFSLGMVNKIRRLKEMLKGHEAAVAAETAPGKTQGCRVAGRKSQGGTKVRPDQAMQIPPEIRRQIGDLGTNALYRLVGERFTRVAHGEDMHLQPLFFQQANFIGNKGFGNAWIAFEYHAHNGLLDVHACSPKEWMRLLMTAKAVIGNRLSGSA
jgi:hypothetical protein